MVQLISQGIIDKIKWTASHGLKVVLFASVRSVFWDGWSLARVFGLLSKIMVI